MPKKNCLNCIAYCNMLADGKCGLGFEVEEVTETSAGFSIAVQPVDECTVAMPRTRKKRSVEEMAHTSAAVRCANTILSRDGYDFPVYFIAVNIGRG